MTKKTTNTLLQLQIGKVRLSANQHAVQQDSY